MNYTIQSGDTLYSIAQKQGTTVNAILAANPGISATIYPGQTIVIPGISASPPTLSSNRTYQVQNGDTLYSVAKRYGTTVDAIMQANQMTETVIHLNQILQIPSSISPQSGGKFDRQRFFTVYKQQFNTLLDKQKVWLDFLLTCFEQDKSLQHNIYYMAYMLATVKHETANTFQPIAEYGDIAHFNQYDPVLAATATAKERARKMGNTQQGDGYKYRGRGFVQLTWKTNYQKFSTITGQDLVNNPDAALDRWAAYQIMSYGMIHGSFTGKKLADFIYANQVNYYDARSIINDHDKADVISGYAEKFQSALLAA
jgi:LysM repeat protein